MFNSYPPRKLQLLTFLVFQCRLGKHRFSQDWLNIHYCVGQLCYSGCEICFTTMAVTVKHNDTIILYGGKDLVSGLWHVDMTMPPTEVSNDVYENHTLPDRIAYLHVACFSPVKDTWIKAIENGNFAMWSGLTLENICKYLIK
jgi:hypothetical protein